MPADLEEPQKEHDTYFGIHVQDNGSHDYPEEHVSTEVSCQGGMGHQESQGCVSMLRLRLTAKPSVRISFSQSHL